MFATRLLICLSMIALGTPALCAQFFIVYDPAAKRCAIVDQAPAPGSGSVMVVNGDVVVIGDSPVGDRPPAGSGPVVVGDGAYGNRPTAEADMRKIAVCAVKR